MEHIPRGYVRRLSPPHPQLRWERRHDIVYISDELSLGGPDIGLSLADRTAFSPLEASGRSAIFRSWPTHSLRNQNYIIVLRRERGDEMKHRRESELDRSNAVVTAGQLCEKEKRTAGPAGQLCEKDTTRVVSSYSWTREVGQDGV